MRTLMQRLRQEGHTIFVSSHVLHEVEQVCDRIAILNHGKVVAQGGVQQLLSGADRIEIQVEPHREAETLLKSLPWITDVSLEGDMLVVQAPLTRSAEITKFSASIDYTRPLSVHARKVWNGISSS